MTPSMALTPGTGAPPVNPPRSTPLDMGLGPNPLGSLGIPGNQSGVNVVASAPQAPPTQTPTSQSSTSQPQASVTTASGGTITNRPFPKVRL